MPSINFPSTDEFVIHIWSSQTTGDDHALPSILVFQAIFFSSDQVVGKPLSPTTIPLPLGPLNSGH